MTLRIGLAGCGWISKFHLEGWRAIPNVEVVATCDLDLARARSLASQYEVPWVGDDVARMLDECELDILDIATNPDSHRSLAIMATEHRVNTLCQKPVALTLADAKAMISAAEKNNVVLYVNEMMRFCPWFQHTRRLMKKNVLGQVGFARFFSRTASFIKAGPTKKIRFGRRDYLKKTSRAIILDDAIHYLDVIRFLFGNPKSVYAVTEHVSPFLSGEDVATILLRYEGMTSVIEESWSTYGPARIGFEIEGLKGAILFSHGRALEYYSAQGSSIGRRYEYPGSWDEQRPAIFAEVFRDFLKVIRSGKHRTEQARDNLETLRLALAAYQSVEAKEEVKL